MTGATGAFTLARPHSSPRSPLRAWSTADELLIEHAASAQPGRLLIVNDEFGALSCALADQDPTVWTDSAMSRASIDANLRANDLPPLGSDRSVRGSEPPQGHFDTVVMRLPKSAALLAHQLAVLGGCVHDHTDLVAGDMARHIHTSTVAAFEAMGPTVTSRATRKARLIHCRPEPAPADPVSASEFGTQHGAAEFGTQHGVVVVEGPGTFSAGHLDVGTALLVDVVGGEAPPPPGSLIADLGSGNGVALASVASAWTDPGLRWLAVDSSDLAVAATRSTWHRNGLPGAFDAVAADGFAGIADESVDVVVTNPPFHQGHAVDPDLTDHLLADAARVLRRDGRAYIVVQRHLQLHTRLRRWFGSVEARSKHPSHVVLLATR